MKIHFASSPCGSGKTHQIIHRACELAHRCENVLIVQPTKQLIDKTVERELLTRPKAVPYRVFHSDEEASSRSVSRQLMEFLHSPVSGGHIVFATHQVLPFIAFWVHKSQWHAFIDEELQVVKQHRLNLPDTHHLLTDHLDVEDFDSIYSRLLVGDLGALAEIAKNVDGDEFYERLREPAQILTNQYWQSFVNSEQFCALKGGKARQLSIHSILMPRLLYGFASVTMAAANFRDCLVYNLWGNMNVEFTEDASLSEELRFQKHENGSLVTVKYATELLWSKTLQCRKADFDKPDDQSVLDAMIEAVKGEFDSQPFLWQANKSLTGNPFGDNAVRLPNVPHGLNDYTQFDRLCFLSALNPRSDHFRFLRSRGLASWAVRRAVYGSAVYQSVMRSSIRDPKSTSPKTIIVPDLAAAKYLAELFPGCRLEKLPTRITTIGKAIGRPRQHGSNRERVAGFRQKQRTNKLKQLLVSHYLVKNGCGDMCANGTCNETPIDVLAHFVTGSTHGTLFANKYSNEPQYLWCENVDWFVITLQFLHEQKYSRKDVIPLMSPAIFDPNRSGGDDKRRGLENVVEVRHLWMDFDGGGLAPELFGALFPRTKMVILNSCSHTPEEPRFRVVFPFDQPLNANEYELLYANVIAKLEDAGFDVGNGKSGAASGLDLSKRTPASIFYLPCQARNPTHSFFYDFYHDDSREMLDPMKWIGHSVRHFPKREIGPRRSDGIFDQSKVDAATEEWRRSPSYPGEGNDRFWAYALELRAAGMDLNDIETKLREQARYGRNPGQRCSQIPSIMKSLGQSSRNALPRVSRGQ